MANIDINQLNSVLEKFYSEMSSCLTKIEEINGNSIKDTPNDSFGNGKGNKKNVTDVTGNKSKKEGDKDDTEKTPPKKGETLTSVSNNAKKVLEDAKKTTMDCLNIIESVDDGTKNVIKSAFDIGTTTIGIISNIGSLTTKLTDSTTLAATGAAGTIKGLESASAILQIISAAIAITKAIMEICDAGNAKIIRDNEKTIKRLEHGYEDLADQIQKVYGFDKSDKIDEQNKNLEEQLRLIEEQKQAEEDKKLTNKDNISDYEEKQRKINKQIKDNEDKSLDAIFGANVESAISSFADAYLSVWDDAGGKIAAQEDIVKDMIKGIMSEMVKNGVSEKVNELRKRIAEAMRSGGIDASEDAQIKADAQAIMDGVNLDAEMMNKYFKEDDPDRAASQKGFGAITQESADELNGKFTIIQEHTFEISNNIKTLVSNSGTMLDHLSGIQNNTSHCKRLEAIERDMSAVKTGIGIITTKGVRMI